MLEECSQPQRRHDATKVYKESSRENLSDSIQFNIRSISVQYPNIERRSHFKDEDLVGFGQVIQAGEK